MSGVAVKMRAELDEWLEFAKSKEGQAAIVKVYQSGLMGVAALAVQAVFRISDLKVSVFELEEEVEKLKGKPCARKTESKRL